jgi:hypothetical protein
MIDVLRFAVGLAADVEPVDDACFARWVARMLEAFERADRDAACPGEGGAIRDAIVSNVGPRLTSISGRGACPERKLEAAGKKIARRLRCGVPDPAAMATECLARADARFVGACDLAERRGPCAGDVETIEYLADRAATAIGALIAGAPTSTTSTTVPGVCGNAIVEPGEQCDGQLFCTPGCTIGPTACCIFPPTEPVTCFPFTSNRNTCLSCISDGGTCETGLCGPNGACEDAAFAPVPICCQFFGGCETDVVSSIRELASIECDYGGSLFGVGICDVDGLCHPGE